MKECKEFAWYLLCLLGKLLEWCIKKSIRFCLWIDRFIVKRYFNLETPIYKLWWRNHALAIQKKLDKIHNTHYAENSL